MGVSESTLSDSDVAFLQRNNNLTAEEIKKLHAIFTLLARGESNNYLTLERMVQACRKAGVSAETIDCLRAIFPVLDRNKNGTVDFQEYVLSIAVMTDQASIDEKIGLAFALFDKDGDNRVSKEEMTAALKYLNRVIEIGEFYASGQKVSEEGEEEPVSGGSEFRILGAEDFDSQIDSWVAKLYTDFDLNRTDSLELDEFKKVVNSHPFLMDLNSRLVTEGPAGILVGCSRK